MATNTSTAVMLDRTKQTKMSAPNAFEQLVTDLSRVLESSSGLTIADVDHTVIEQMMQAYQSDSKEWQQYAFSDPSRGYTRNLVDAGKGKSNLVSLAAFGPRKMCVKADKCNSWCWSGLRERAVPSTTMQMRIVL